MDDLIILHNISCDVEGGRGEWGLWLYQELTDTIKESISQVKLYFLNYCK
jgi:hypothetical protein